MGVFNGGFNVCVTRQRPGCGRVRDLNGPGSEGMPKHVEMKVQNIEDGTEGNNRLAYDAGIPPAERKDVIIPTS
jgi:hypothetical protein